MNLPLLRADGRERIERAGSSLFKRELFCEKKERKKRKNVARDKEEELLGGGKNGRISIFQRGEKKWGEIRREDFAIKAINIICLYGSRMKICRRWRPMYLGEKITQDFIHHRFREREIRIFNSQIVRYKRDS